ncbi:MAG TPA: hypothetical protein VJM82_06220 [Nitrospiraceae bacterium]|nr:hypothetical protein [Nitrospiraceae bacterium]
MRAVTIQLDDGKFEALEAIAKENGLSAAEGLLRQEIERVIASYRGPGLTRDLQQHLKASIDENRGLLERLP